MSIAVEQASLRPLLDKRVLFVGGKGGVGKTTTAAALALKAAELGRSVLLVSTDPAHSLGDIFERSIGGRVTRLAVDLDGLEIDAEAEADRHIEEVCRTVRGLVKGNLADEAERQIRLARHAPGAVEAALLERIADIVLENSGPNRLVIFDTAPIGHTMRLLSLPETMAAWTNGMLRHHQRSTDLQGAFEHLGGAGQGDDLGTIEDRKAFAENTRLARVAETLLERRRKFHQVRRIITDGDKAGFVLVLTPERLPIDETAKARHFLEEQNVPVAAVIVNRVLPAEADGAFLSTRRQREGVYLKRIAEISEGLTSISVPLLATDVVGFDQLRQISDLLFAS